MTTTAARERHFELAARVLAERLHGRGPSAGLRAALQGGSALGWEGVVGQASDDFVLPALAAAVRDLGLLEPLEPQLAAFLRAILAANAERNAGLRDELAATVRALNAVQVEPVLLKGAVRLVDGLYPELGWRMMRDLDLLVPEAKLDEAVAALGELGYAACRMPPGSRRARRHHHYPALARPGCIATVELHTELFSSARRRRLLSGAEVLGATRRAAFAGVRARVPSVDHQMTHLIGHCQISNRYLFGGWAPLRDLLEAAALEVWSPEPPDWQAIGACFAAAGYSGALIGFVLSSEAAGFRPTAAAAQLDPRMRLWRRSAHGAATPIGRMRLRTALWSAFLGELVLEPEMRRKARRRSADAILQRLCRGPSTR